jgi:hypothetical protein
MERERREVENQLIELNNIHPSRDYLLKTACARAFTFQSAPTPRKPDQPEL